MPSATRPTAALLALAPLLAACWVSRYDAVPAVSGIAWRADAPVPALPLRIGLGADSTCAAPVRDAVTDSTGAFAMAALRRREWTWVLSPPDRQVTWHLCAPAAAADVPADAAWHPAFRFAGAAYFTGPFHCRLELGDAVPVASCGAAPRAP